MSALIKGSKAYIDLNDTDTAKTIRLQNNAGDLQTIDPSTGSEVTINGVKITAHGSRHNRGGADPIDWSSISKYRKVSGSGNVGPNGSPALIAELSVENNYYNLLPLRVNGSVSNLGTGESVSVKLTVVDNNGNEIEIANKTGITGSFSISSAEIDLGPINDGSQIRSIKLYAESSATSTNASITISIVALQL